MRDFDSQIPAQKYEAPGTSTFGNIIVKEEPGTEPVSEIHDISSEGSPEHQQSSWVEEVPKSQTPELPPQQDVILERFSEIRRLLEQLQQGPAQSDSLSKVHMDVVEKLVEVSKENGALKLELSTLRNERLPANQQARIETLEKDNASLRMMLKQKAKDGQNLGESGTKKRKLDERHATPDRSATGHETFASQVAAIVHACHCQEPNCSVKNCALTKNNVKHALVCQKRARGECFFCGQFQALCWYHSESCSGECPVPFCSKFRKSSKAPVAE